MDRYLLRRIERHTWIVITYYQNFQIDHEYSQFAYLSVSETVISTMDFADCGNLDGSSAATWFFFWFFFPFSFSGLFFLVFFSIT